MAFLSQSDLDTAGAKAFTAFMMGGKSKGRNPSDLDPDELKLGIEVELEHTDDKTVARKIALDHLTEHPLYYTALKAMETVLKSMEGRTGDETSFADRIKAKLQTEKQA